MHNIDDNAFSNMHTPTTRVDQTQAVSQIQQTASTIGHIPRRRPRLSPIQVRIGLTSRTNHSLPESPRLPTLFSLPNTFKFTKCRSPIVRTLCEHSMIRKQEEKQKLRMDHRSSIPFLTVLRKPLQTPIRQARARSRRSDSGTHLYLHVNKWRRRSWTAKLVHRFETRR